MPAPSDIHERVAELYDAFARSDTAWIPDFISRSNPLVIGTDQKEWWDGYESAAASWIASREQFGGTQLRPTRLQTRIHDQLAWAADEPEFALSNGAKGRFRLTLIFTWESDAWRLIHLHASVPVPNESLGQA